MALSDVDLTPLLERRPARAPDYAAENATLLRLGNELANPTGDILGALAEQAARLCAAGSAGISILEPGAVEPIFRWHALRGEWAKYEGQGLPRGGSPCGVTIERNRVCLMRQPQRHFPAVAAADPPIHEVLLAPFPILGEPLGTVWIISHDMAKGKGREFDAEDARVVQNLARFASNAFLLQHQIRHATELRDDLYRANRRLTRILQQFTGATTAE